MRSPPLIAFALVAFLLGGCLFGSPSASATPSARPSKAASVAPTRSAPPATPTVAPTPGPDKIPIFTAGATVATAAAGLRVRSAPGTTHGVLALLPTGSKLVVELGPVRTDGYGWYLVLDADSRAPAFKEGWVAAGFVPNPYLAPATFKLSFNPIVAGFAHEGNAEYGPVPIKDANYAVRWVASVLPGGGGCSFSVDLVPASGKAVPAIRATIGTAPAPGNLYSDYFASHPELTGDLLLRITSDCSWALTFMRSQPIGG
jgi:hypothetical protein